MGPHLARAILFSSTVTEKRTKLGVGQVMVLMAHLSTDSADSHPIHHFTSVTVVPSKSKTRLTNSKL